MAHSTKSLIERSASRPRALPVNPDGIPAVLKALPQWVCWRYSRREDARGNSKWTKIPICPRTGQSAKANDPATWATCAAALDYYRRHSGDVDGIGFVFAEDDPFSGVDLDNARDPQTGKLAPWAARVVEALDSYAEVSPSGTGAKIFVTAQAPGKGHRKPFPGAPAGGQIEIYSERRYYTLTGRCLADAPATVNERQEPLDRLYAEVWRHSAGTNGHASQSQPPNGQASADDQALIDKALRARNGAKFARLWHGSTAGYPSPSEADLALCDMLAFWAGPDPDRIARLFRQSGLACRNKSTQRADYLQRTIATALASRTEFYSPRPPRQPPASGGNGHSEDGELPDTPDEGPTGYDVILAHFQRKYDPAFRRDTSLYSTAFGRLVKPAEACYAPGKELVEKLAAAIDAPRNDSGVKRGALPQFFRTWAPSAWSDLLDGLPEEEAAAEISDPAQEEFRNRISRALHTLVSFGREIKGGMGETEVQRRSLISWCDVWAKAGSWAQARSLLIWMRRDEASVLHVAVRVELFAQVHVPDLSQLSQRKFAALCERYSVGSAGGECRPCGRNAVELDSEFIAQLQAGVDGLRENSPVAPIQPRTQPPMGSPRNGATEE